MSIQWFPGHMNTARKKAEESMKKVDLIIEVLDSRFPKASSNPMIEQLRLHRQRPCLKILNKSDLADPKVTQEWISYYNNQESVKSVSLSCKKLSDVENIPNICLTLVPFRGTPLKPLRIMIMGIPNVGKSTLLNSMLKRHVAKVRDEPAVTKSQQRFYLNNNIVLIDTPGMLWPKILYPSDALILASSNSIGTNALIDEEVATFLADELLIRYASLLVMRYNIRVEYTDGSSVVEDVAKSRSFRLKGGGLDLGRASRTLLQDYRTGLLGRISLETPKSRSELLKSS